MGYTAGQLTCSAPPSQLRKASLRAALTTISKAPSPVLPIL